MAAPRAKVQVRAAGFGAVAKFSAVLPFLLTYPEREGFSTVQHHGTTLASKADAR